MPERHTYDSHEQAETLQRRLSDKPVEEMSTEEFHGWYLEYMKTVDEENVMMLSGMPIEICDDPDTFAHFVAAKQREMKESETTHEV